MFTFSNTAETPVGAIGVSYILTTSHDLSRYAVIKTDGNMININGCFKEDRITDFYVDTNIIGAVKQAIKVNDDGTFNGYFGGVPVVNNSHAVLVFESGKKCLYRIDYNDKGWFFSVNGLDERTRDNVENYVTVSDEVSAYYVCEDLDVAKTRETLDEIRSIAFEVTDGLTDDYEKAKALSAWVSENIYYDNEARNKEVTLSTVTLENVLETRTTVCTGYANLYAALLEAAGITAVNIQGGVTSTGKCTYEELAIKTVKHEWVAFYYEKQMRWVYADVVWDSGNIYVDNKFIPGNLPMKYFDIDGLTLSLTHRGDKAELRNFMNAAEFVQGGASVLAVEGEEAQQAAESAETTTVTEPVIKSGQTPDIASKSDYFPEDEAEDNTLLIIAVGVLSLGVIITTIVLIKQLKGR